MAHGSSVSTIQPCSRRLSCLTCGFWDTRADRQTYTREDRNTLHSSRGQSKTVKDPFWSRYCRLVVPCIRRTVLCRAWYRRSRDTGASRDGLLLLTDLPADWSDRTRVLLTIQVSVCHLIYSYRHVYLSNMHTWPLRLRLLRLARTLSAYRESNLINSTAL